MKKQFSILIADAEGEMKDKDLTGWVVQIPEHDSVSLCPECIINAAYESNTTQRGQRMLVETIGDSLRSRYS